MSKNRIDWKTMHILDGNGACVKCGDASTPRCAAFGALADKYAGIAVESYFEFKGSQRERMAKAVERTIDTAAFDVLTGRSKEEK